MALPVVQTEDTTSTYVEQRLGPIEKIGDIPSESSPFRRVTAKVYYPSAVIEALQQLLAEYNLAFSDLLRDHIDHPTDYHHCSPAALAVQIDMVALTPAVLRRLAAQSVNEVREYLRPHIFEIENSIAMYGLLSQLFSDNGPSAFHAGWRRTLDDARRRTGKPVAILAITQNKYNEMLRFELGLKPGDQPSPEFIRRHTGFDAILGPDEFRAHLADNNSECRYALFVRSSQPVEKLRDPRTNVKHPLLEEPKMVQIIRANALTINVDDPSQPDRKINDTKAYMPTLGIGYAITEYEDLDSDGFRNYLGAFGVSWEDVLSGRVLLRCKPGVDSYGAYGHITAGFYPGRDFRKELRLQLRRRGGYIVQPELNVPLIHNLDTGKSAAAIDRIFFGYYNGQMRLLSGFRNYMPTESAEWRARRVHGNGDAFWAEILPEEA